MLDDPVNTGTELPPTGHEIAPSVKAPPEFVGGFMGQEIVSAGTVPALPVNVSAGTVPALPAKLSAVTVGTPAGHAIVPVGVRVCVWPARADPVNVWAGTVTVAFAVAAVPASVVNANVTPEDVTILVPTEESDDVPFVPDGVPPLVDEVVPAPPAKVGTPAGQEIVPAVFVPAGVKLTVPLVPAGVKETVELVGTFIGHAIVGCVNTPAAIVGTGVGHATVPDGVTVDVALVPAGVKEAVPLVPAGVKLTVPFVPAGV